METKKKTFDAVSESRKWREVTSRKLEAMPMAERLAYLQKVAASYRKNHARRKTVVRH